VSAGYKIYNQLYKLLTNPRTKDIKINAYESLIYDTFLENGGKIRIEDVIKLAERKFYLTNLSRLLIIKVLKSLEEEGNIIKKGNIYVIEDKFFSKIKENYKNNKNNYENFIEYIISCVNNMVDPQLTTTEKKMVESFLQRTLFEIFNRYTDNVVEIYGGRVSFIPLPQLEDVINEIFEESVTEKSERELLIQDAFLRTLKKLFYHPTEIFSTGLRIIANRHLLYKIIVKNPPTEKITLDIFKKVKLFIDTNILISYLCKESQMHDITNGLLKESHKLGAQIFLSNWTEGEFRNTLNHAKYLLDVSRRKKIKPEIFENEILQTFLRRKNEKEWIDFLKELSLAFSIMEKEGIILKRKCKDDDVTSEIDNVEKVIKKGLRELGVERHPSLILHDAKMITYVQNIREEKTPSIGTVWFLTRDYRLKEIEKRYINELGYKFESAITPDIWFEIILPFISADVKEKDVSIAFSKIIASAILPLPFDIVEQFLSYLEASLDLPKEEENILKGMVEEAHIRGAIEQAISDGDIIGGIQIITDNLKDELHKAKEKEEYEKIIRKLVAEVRSYKDVLPKVILDKTKFEKLKERVLSAKNNDEKGKTLEDLISYLMECINGLEIIDRGCRLEAEEIDIIVGNGAFSGWGDPIIVECKNWSRKVGSKEIVAFKEKMTDLDCKTGIFVAMRGITGNECKDAKLKVRWALREKKHIIIIEWQDIEKIKNGEDWVQILKKKYYLPQKLALSMSS